LALQEVQYNSAYPAYALPKAHLSSAGAGSLLKTASGALAQGVGVDPAVIPFFTNQNNSPATGKPRAYLNVLFFDAESPESEAIRETV